MSQPHPIWLDPALRPSAENCVVSRLIERHAALTPDEMFIRFENGEEWSWKRVRELARSTAAALQARGAKQGDIIAAWAPNSPELVRTWFGASYIGAALAPINTSFRGRLIDHALDKIGARILMAHPRLLERLDEKSLAKVDHIISMAEEAPAVPPGVIAEGIAALDGDSSLLVESEVAPSGTSVIIFTSGTTGPSKAVVTSYVQQWMTARSAYGYMTRDDRILVNLPMFHVGGISAITAALASGGSVALFEAFDTRNFWTHVRETGSTTCSGFLGALVSFLSNEPARPTDADNPLRMCTLSPLTEETVALARRFGFQYISGFNMTEVSTPLVTDIDETVMRSCGRPRQGVECRIVDDNDNELPHGQVGELILRTENRLEMFKEYLGDPEATEKAWRNGWFHTGDLLWRDEEGRFYFADRKKDAIRRRGENISSMEIEIDVAAHPAIQEVAAYGVDQPGGEQEVMVCVALKPGVSLAPRELIEFLIPRMAHFMIPRFVRILDALPKTPTNKIRKADLRKEGVTADSWDRESEGLIIKREKLR